MTFAFVVDLRQAAKSLARSPGFSTVAVVTLAASLGFATAIYAALKHVVMDPLPHPDSERLMVLASEVPGSGTDDAWGASTAQYVHFRDHAQSLADIGFMDSASVGVAGYGDGGAVKASVAVVTAGIHRMIGARALHGRLFAEPDDDPGAPPLAVLGEGFWRTHFGADPDIVGNTVRLDIPWEQGAIDVIGVAATPGGTPLDETDIWLPKFLDPAGPYYNQHSYVVLALRRADVSLAAAQADAQRLTRELTTAFPSVYPPSFIEDFGFRSRWCPLRECMIQGAAAPLWIAQGGTALLLLVGWVAVANLFLAWIETRHPEMAVRQAFGAGRGAVLRQLASSSALLVAGAWIVGILIAWWVSEVLAALPLGIPRMDEIAVDDGVLLASLVTAFLVAISFVGLAAWRMRRASGRLVEAGRGTTASRDRQRARSALVAAQVAVAFVLLVGAGLLLSSFRNLAAVNPGIDPTGTVHIQLGPDSGQTGRWHSFLQELIERVSALPGVDVAGASQSLPLDRGFFGCVAQYFEDEGIAERLAAAELTSCGVQDFVTPGYFEAVGMPLLRGRTLDWGDFNDPARRSAVVSAAFAAKFFNDQPAIGQRVAPYGWPWFTVVGVVGDTYGVSVADEPTAHVYYPLSGIPADAGWNPMAMQLVVRTELGDPTAILPTVRRLVTEMDPNIVMAAAEPLAAVLERATSQDRFMAVLLAAAATASLLLAVIGLYGVVAFLAARRTAEIGVRMAVGARPGDIRRMMVLGSLKTVAFGVVIGAGASLGLAGLVRGVLFGVAPTNPAVYVASALLLLLAGGAASWLATRQATRITPLDALRVQ